MDQAKLKESLEKVPFSLLFVVFAGYLAYDYYWFTSDAASPLIAKQGEVQALKNEVTGLRGKIKDAQEFFRTLEAKKTELRMLAQQLDGMKSTLATDIDVPNFMRTVVTEAHKIGITVLSLRPTEAGDKEFYHEQAFEFVFRGVYVQLLVFLDRLSNIKTIVRVENFEINPVGSASNQYVELQGSLQLKAYSYVRSKADEVASGKGASAGASGVVAKGSPGPGASPPPGKGGGP